MNTTRQIAIEHHVIDERKLVRIVGVAPGWQFFYEEIEELQRYLTNAVHYRGLPWQLAAHVLNAVRRRESGL